MPEARSTALDANSLPLIRGSLWTSTTGIQRINANKMSWFTRHLQGKECESAKIESLFILSLRFELWGKIALISPWKHMKIKAEVTSLNLPPEKLVLQHQGSKRFINVSQICSQSLAPHIQIDRDPCLEQNPQGAAQRLSLLLQPGRFLSFWKHWQHTWLESCFCSLAC